MAAGPARTLTQRELNRAILARQLLLDRPSLPIPRALERIGGIQAQYAPSMYIGLWSRLAGLERAAVTRAIEDRSAVVGTLMRTTIHLVSADDYWPFSIAIRDSRRDWWLRVNRHQQSAAAIEEAAERVRERLRAASPIGRKELDVLTGPAGAVGVGLWVDLVRVPPSSTWERRRADLFALAEDWLGAPPAVAVEEAQLHLARRYLEGFGPSTAGEIATWAGLPKSAVSALLPRLDLRRFRAEDGDELVDLPDAPLPDVQTSAAVRFLPVWDAILLAHARRAVVIAEDDRSRVFNTRTPHSLNTFTVDGCVAGTWAYTKKRVEVIPFRPLPRKVRRDVDAEAERLAAFHA